MPFVVMVKTVALTGERHAGLAAFWLDMNDTNMKAAPSAFTIGQIVANSSPNLAPSASSYSRTKARTP